MCRACNNKSHCDEELMEDVFSAYDKRLGQILLCKKCRCDKCTIPDWGQIMWLWIISNIAGSLLGASTTEWFKDTKAGKWCFDKYLGIVYWASEKYGIDILNKEEISWRQKYPGVNSKIVELESRIEKLERKNNGKSV